MSNGQQTKYWARFDVNGLPLAFYVSDVWPTQTEGSVEITDVQWREFIENQGLRKWSNGTVVAYAPPVMPAPIPASASKLGLKRAFTELGQWDNVKAYLAANPDLQEDWDLAIEIKRTDPLTQGAVTALNLSSDQVDALLVRANELVA